MKMRRCFTDPHYWKNPALRRSREKISLNPGLEVGFSLSWGGAKRAADLGRNVPRTLDLGRFFFQSRGVHFASGT